MVHISALLLLIVSMSFLHPDMLPYKLRRIGRMLVPASARATIAAGMQEFANSQYRLYPSFYSNQRRVANLKDSKKGEVCVIIGNGPSMRDFDLGRLRGTDAFCLNRGYLLWQAAKITPRYLVVTNPLVVEQFASELASVDADHFLPWEHRRRFVGDNSVFLMLRWKAHFSLDIAKGIWGGGTVTFAAMQIAYYLGYSRVVLIGVDHSFNFDGTPNSELVATGADQNHFTPDYFSNGVKWHAPDLALSEISYAMARDAFAADGREIVDATEGGQLQLFPKVCLEQILA